MSYSVEYIDMYDRELDNNQRMNLFRSFSDIHPYLNSFYLIGHFCPKTKLKHVSVVFNFKPDTTSSFIPELSDRFKNLWKLHNFPSHLFDRNPDEIWKDGCIARFGIPPIQVSLPACMIHILFPGEAKTFHVDGDSSCFE